MRLDDAAAHIGSRVRYWPLANGGPKPEFGKVTEVRGGHVFVLYDGDRTAKATRPDDLELVRPPGQRRNVDWYSNTPEDAAKFEAHVGPDLDWAYDDRPTRQELEAEAAEERQDRRRRS